MSNGALASLVASLMMLAWVGSAFVSRQVPVKQTVKMALAWVAIFAVGLLLFSLFNGNGSSSRTDEVAPSSNLA